MTLLHVPVLPSWVDFLSISISTWHIRPLVQGAGNQRWRRGRGFLFCFAFFSPSIHIHLMNELCISLNLTQMRVLPHSHDLMGLIPIRAYPKASLKKTPLGLCMLGVERFGNLRWCFSCCIIDETTGKGSICNVILPLDVLVLSGTVTKSPCTSSGRQICCFF